MLFDHDKMLSIYFSECLDCRQFCFQSVGLEQHRIRLSYTDIRTN